MNPLLLALTLATSTAATPAPRVYVGVYLLDVSDLDLKAGRFKADARVWLKWKGDETPPPLLFDNAELDSKEELSKESEGDWRTVQWRVQGTFRGEFPLHDFPFDAQTLSLDFSLPESSGRLVPDLAASGMAQAFSITGWQYERAFQAAVDAHTYGSDFGSIAREGETTAVDRVRFSLHLARPLEPYLLKFLVPLSIILLMAVLALFLPVGELEVRSAMGVTALLSVVAFHFSQADSLPDVSYLVAADKLFLGAYVLCIVTLVVTVVSFNVRERFPTAVTRVDRVFGLATPLVAVVGVFVLLQRPTAPPPPEPPRPAATVAAKRSVLRLGLAGSLKQPTSGGLWPLTRRGLVTRTATGGLEPLLVVEAPTMTNGLVRLLPDGGLVIRWRLREGLRWSDGTALTVKDCVETLGVNPLARRRAVRVLDERTFEVEYADRRADDLEGFSPLPPSLRALAGTDGGLEASNQASATPGSPTAGPYVIAAFEADKKASFGRNPHFAGPAPAFERVEVTVFGASDEVAAQLLEGALDAAPGLGPQGVEALTGKADFTLHSQLGEVLYVLHVDPAVPALASPAVRRAFLEAIDRRSLVALLRPVPASVARGLTPAIEAFDVPYDPVAARAHFAEAGLRRVKLTGMAGKPGTPPALVLGRIMGDLLAAGLEVELASAADTNSLFLSRTHGGLLLTARGVEVPARFFNVPWDKARGTFVTDAPVPGFFEPPMIELNARLKTTLYDERRDALLGRLSVEWAKHVSVVPLVFTSKMAATRVDLEGPELGSADSLLWNVERWTTRDVVPLAPVAP
ncbi:MAG: ABC transporter substrate-binding protein [Myxococcaceae bacterium]|nr:ABC transporter substrate-binding protein [Myxococcaceae bacterium]